MSTRPRADRFVRPSPDVYGCTNSPCPGSRSMPMSIRSIADPPTRRTLLTALLAIGGAPFISISQPRFIAMTPNIDPDAKLTTLINVFSVVPADRDRLVVLLREGTDAWISKVPGFISSSLHVSRDGERVVIYGQWRSADGIA